MACMPDVSNSNVAAVPTARQMEREAYEVEFGVSEADEALRRPDLTPVQRFEFLMMRRGRPYSVRLGRGTARRGMKRALNEAFALNYTPVGPGIDTYQHVAAALAAYAASL